MKTTITILAIVAIGVGAASLIPVCQVGAQSQGPPTTFPSEGAKDACNAVTQTFHEKIPFRSTECLPWITISPPCKEALQYHAMIKWVWQIFKTGLIYVNWARCSSQWVLLEMLNNTPSSSGPPDRWTSMMTTAILTSAIANQESASFCSTAMRQRPKSTNWWTRYGRTAYVVMQDAN